MNRLESLTAQKETYSSELISLEKSITEAAQKHFEESGGCQRCRGRGWVVTWDTLDSMTGCYHEHTSCTEEGCTVEARERSGLLPKNLKYDNFHRGSQWYPKFSDQENERKTFLQGEISRLSREIREEEWLWQPGAGKIAKVVKSGRGRKDRRVPVGVEGLIKKIHTNDWGTAKAILIDSDGKKWWPSVSQIEITDPEPDTSHWDDLDVVSRTQTGYPVVAVVKKKTARAALIRTTTAKEFWIPYSQVPELQNSILKEAASILMPMWLAEKNGLVTKDS